MPLTGATSYTDAGAAAGSTYTVRPVVGGVEQAALGPARALATSFLDVPISVPSGGYTANDASVGDLDGDGDYEIVLKWDPANSRDNSQAGATGNVYVDAYDLAGTRLWRIDLGRNIRAGAHYTQFMVYDLDGDGRSEVAMKTADGTRSGTGQVVGDAGADHRNADGYILTGPEYLTVFDGRSGGVLATAGYIPARGNVSAWGDSYGNRVDRFLATVAYLDGQRPSLVFSRGYYTRTVLAAWDFRDGRLTSRWVFDSNTAPAYAGQGNHNVSVADVDADGRDEIMLGAMAVDDDGRGLWSTGDGHGDAYHVGDLDPDRPGLEVFDVQERVGNVGVHFDDARTGATIWRKPSGSGATEGPGRGVAADVWAGSRGAEMWASGGGLSGRMWNRAGADVGRAPSTTNFVVWWDGDPVRELLDGVAIDRYGPGGDQRLLTGSGVAANNGTKATPALSADLLGDWREEVVWRTADSRALRIYMTTAPTDRRITTLMHDPQYRLAVAWQNVAYNQPPHPSFYLGDGMATPPAPRSTCGDTDEGDAMSTIERRTRAPGLHRRARGAVLAAAVVAAAVVGAGAGVEPVTAGAAPVAPVQTAPATDTWYKLINRNSGKAVGRAGLVHRGRRRRRAVGRPRGHEPAVAVRELGRRLLPPGQPVQRQGARRPRALDRGRGRRRAVGRPERRQPAVAARPTPAAAT